MKAYNNVIAEKMTEYHISESRKNTTTTISNNFSKSCFRAELENDNVYKLGHKITPEEVRHIILGNEHPENKFRELKTLLANVHWIPQAVI
jgi:hypothetical protein